MTKDAAIAKTLQAAQLLHRSRFVVRLPASLGWTANVPLWELDTTFKHIPAADIIECRADGTVVYPVEGVRG